MEPEQHRRRRCWALLKLGFRLLVLGIVIWGIWRTVEQASARFAAANFSIRQLDLRWLLLAAAFYVLGMSPCWWFWHQTLHAMGQFPRLGESLKAYWVGHLGKYVPGKALVVVLRTGLIRGERVNTTVAALSVFVETLTMMAVGSFVAALILALRSDQPWLILLSCGLMLASGVPTLPPIFRQIVRMLRVGRIDAQVDDAIGGLRFPLMLWGWSTITAGWVLMGLSLWATLGAMPVLGGTTYDVPPPLDQLPLLVASVALAMVAGFLSLLPGGVGVRDLLLITLLSGSYGQVTAIISAVLLRLVWLLSELLVSGILVMAVRGAASPRGLSSEQTG